jgi:hypothetical protein
MVKKKRVYLISGAIFFFILFYIFSSLYSLKKNQRNLEDSDSDFERQIYRLEDNLEDKIKELESRIENLES